AAFAPICAPRRARPRGLCAVGQCGGGAGTAFPPPPAVATPIRVLPDVPGSSEIEARQHRDVIRRSLPAAHGAQDAAGMTCIGDIRAGPDMVEPAALVSRVPVARAVGPPTVELPLGD